MQRFCGAYNFNAMTFKFETCMQFHAQIKLVVVKFSIPFTLISCEYNYGLKSLSLSMHNNTLSLFPG